MMQVQNQSSEDVHSQALKMMMRDQKDDDDARDARSTRFQSPCPLSPQPRGTPSRMLPPYPLSPGPLEAVPSRTLGLNITPKRTPKSHGKMIPGMKSPAINASPFVICESGGTIFGFTIRKADDCALGLDLSPNDTDRYLEVTAVKPGGAMQAWNKQCVGGPAAGKAVMPGDRIVKVNSATTPNEMLQECREQKLLKFMVQRGEVDDEFDTVSMPPWKSGF